MEEQAELVAQPRTGPCLVRGDVDGGMLEAWGEMEKSKLQTSSANRWERSICPMAERGCKYAQEKENFDGVCSEDYSSCLMIFLRKYSQILEGTA